MAVVGTNDWRAIAYGNGQYVAIGVMNARGYMTNSADGETWTTPAECSISQGCYWTAITYANGKFVAVGASNYMGAGYITTSLNGVTWTEPQKLADIKALSGITYGNGKFVAVGSAGKITTSVNGTSWTAPTWFDSAHNMIDVVFGNDKFVAVGNSGSIGISTDAVKWTKTNVYNGFDVSNAVTYGNGLFVMVGYTSSYGYIATSQDGLTWTMRLKTEADAEANPRDYQIKWYDVIFNNGTFIAVGYKAYNRGSYVTTSSDGITWTTPVQLTDENGVGITANINGIFPMQ